MAVYARVPADPLVVHRSVHKRALSVWMDLLFFQRTQPDGLLLEILLLLKHLNPTKIALPLPRMSSYLSDECCPNLPKEFSITLSIPPEIFPDDYSDTIST